MMALTEKRRRFVWALMTNPEANQADWAREAGFSDVAEGCKVRACECLQNPKVRAAIQEVARSTLHGIGPALAVAGLINIAKKPDHKDYAKAVEMILNRTGFGEKQQIEVVHRDLTGDALMERVRLLAEKHGVDLGRLVGLEPKLIEHKADEVGS